MKLLGNRSKTDQGRKLRARLEVLIGGYPDPKAAVPRAPAAAVRGLAVDAARARR